jgi:radical SAM protein with 4Fe4S-binding SPASM domain
LYASGTINTGTLAATPKDIELARYDVLGDLEVELVKQSCTAGMTSVTVDHEGFVVGCEQNTRSRFGSLLNSSLREICQSSEYRQYMEGFYRRPTSCDICPDELSRFCNWCPATPLNFGIAKEGWQEFHCGAAMRSRLFWTGRRSPVDGSRPAAQNTFTLAEV